MAASPSFHPPIHKPTSGSLVNQSQRAPGIAYLGDKSVEAMSRQHRIFWSRRGAQNRGAREAPLVIKTRTEAVLSNLIYCSIGQQWLSSRDNFTSPGHLAMSGDVFGYHNW